MSSHYQIPITREQFEDAARVVHEHARHTPLHHSRILSERSGYEVYLKAEIFQRTGSYKLRGPLNKLRFLSEEQRRRGVVCSSAGNHAQGLALAAAIHGIPAVVVMAANATPSKIEATRGYGAEVVLHGSIWDEADAHARRLVTERGMTYVHPFDDLELIAGQGTLGMEIIDDLPETGTVIVPIGGGGLISGVAMAVKACDPSIKVIGVESTGAPGMRDSVAAGQVVELDRVDCIIDGLRVKRVGTINREVVSQFVDEIVTLPDSDIFDAVVWTMHHCKLVVEGAAASSVAALLHGLVNADRSRPVVAVLTGGNVNLGQLNGLKWN